MTTVAPGTLSTPGQAPTDANTGRPETEDDIAVLRQDVQTDKTEIITRNINFTEEQAKAFWPVYRDYVHEQQEMDSLELRKRYVPKFTKAIGPRQTVKFYQVESRLNLLTNVRLASLLPIIR